MTPSLKLTTQGLHLKEKMDASEDEIPISPFWGVKKAYLQGRTAVAFQGVCLCSTSCGSNLAWILSSPAQPGNSWSFARKKNVSGFVKDLGAFDAQKYSEAFAEALDQKRWVGQVGWESGWESGLFLI